MEMSSVVRRRMNRMTAKNAVMEQTVIGRIVLSVAMLKKHDLKWAIKVYDEMENNQESLPTDIKGITDYVIEKAGGLSDESKEYLWVGIDKQRKRLPLVAVMYKGLALPYDVRGNYSAPLAYAMSHRDQFDWMKLYGEDDDDDEGVR